MKLDKIVELGGNEYKVRMSVGALIAIEEDLGTPITKLSGDLSIKETTLFLKHSLRKENGERLKKDEWETLLDEIEPQELSKILSDIMEGMNQKTNEGDTKNE